MKYLKKHKMLGTIVVSMLIGTFLSPIITCGVKNSSDLIKADDNNMEVTPAKKQAISLENAFQEVFEKVSPSVVSIATERTVNYNIHPFMDDPFFNRFFGKRNFNQKKFKQSGLGSGIILNKEGYILTNQHVVKDMDKLTVKLKNNKSYDAKLVGLDKVVDIALLKISAPSSELTPAVLGDSSKIKVGSWAIAMGSPLGFEQSFTVGIVSAVQRSGIDESGLSYIQTDAAINQGNSGGPLLDIYGRVIGINRMIVSPSGGSVGIGFSIPINEAKNVVQDLKKYGKVTRPWLGVGLDSISEEAKKELKLNDTEGAIIKQIVQGSPADKAGLRIFDVIKKMDGKFIKTPEDVIKVVRSAKIGDRIHMSIVREGKTIRTVATLLEKDN